MDITRFKACLNFTMGHEGGFVNDPVDKGGPTSRGGITLKTLRHLSATVLGHDWDKDDDGDVDVQDLALLTDDDLRVAYAKYYNDNMDQIQSDVVAIKLFDFGFNCGPESATKLLQRAANELHHGAPLIVDGKLGPHTVNVVNSLPQQALTVVFIEEAIKHYHAIVAHDATQAKYIKGWINRANRIPNHG